MVAVGTNEVPLLDARVGEVADGVAETAERCVDTRGGRKDQWNKVAVDFENDDGCKMFYSGFHV